MYILQIVTPISVHPWRNLQHPYIPLIAMPSNLSATSFILTMMMILRNYLFFFAKASTHIPTSPPWISSPRPSFLQNQPSSTI